MFEASEFLKRVQGSERSQIKLLASINMISMNMGEPDFPTPDHIQEAAFRAMKDNFTHYLDPQGDRELREAICFGYLRDYGVERNPEQILITTAAIEALNIISASYINPGDEAIVMDPEYSGITESIRLFSGHAVCVPTTEDLRPNFNAIENSITPKTRMIIVSNPCNPTGQVLRKDEMLRIIAIANQHHLILVVDEMYDKLIYDGVEYSSICQFKELAEQAILVNGFSKTYAMTGWRIGYIIAPTKVIQQLLLVHRALLTCVNAPSQKACVAAIMGSQDCVRKMVAEFTTRKQLVEERLKKISLLLVPPCDGTFFFFSRFNHKFTSREMTNYLAENGVMVRSGSEFGENGQKHLRISFANSLDNLKEGLDRIERAFNRLE